MEPVATTVKTIVALHQLVSVLIERVQDRKLAAEMRDIQKLVSTLQSEHFSLHEENLKLRSDELSLKKQIAALESKIADSENQRAKRGEEITHRGTKFVRSAITGMKWHPYCPVCDKPARSIGEHIRMLCASAPTCSWKTEFEARELESVIATLPSGAVRERQFRL